MINLRTREEIKKIEKACKISAKALKLAGSMCEEGVNTFKIDEVVRKFIISEKARPNFLNYNGYPRSCCISVNDMVIHGIPTRKVVLKKGDIVSIDVGAEFDGYHGDNAYTFIVGSVSEEVKKFVSVTENSLYNGIERAIEGNRVGDISFTIQNIVQANGYSVIREFVGHGVGENLHEEPEIPNFLDDFNFKGPRLVEGMVIAIEPMTTIVPTEIEQCEDGWGIKTKSNVLAAHFEHTVLITKSGPVALTLL